MNKMILMRGIPGGGKSTRARELAMTHLIEGGSSVAICSTDDYHMEDGEYVFKPNMLRDFHVRNQIRAYDLMRDGVQLVIIDNTNIKRKDMTIYTSNARACKYEVEEEIVGKEFLVPNMDMDPHAFAGYINTCAERNTHGVPKDVIERMARTFEV
tara:strand:- start:173 stop:637 length:465 start_codon:yes stop_codon:yes gene_type:complete